MTLQCPAGCSCWGNPLLSISQKQISLCWSPVFLCSCLPEGLSCHGIKPIAPSQLWPPGDSGSGGAFAPSLGTKTEPRVIQVCFMQHWMKTLLVVAPDYLHLFPPNQIPPWATSSDPRMEILSTT
jgi:hypothetical protein